MRSVPLMAMLALAGCGGLHREVRSADLDFYRGIRDGAQWRNPWIYLHEGRVELESRTPYVRRITVPVAELRKALVHLPPESWPYGRVIAVSASGPDPASDEPHALKRKTAKNVDAVLERLDIEATRWP